MRDGISQRPIKIALYLFLLSLLVLAFSPLSFWEPNAGLDSSWVALVNEAFAKHWRWGGEVAFTYGPLGFLVLRQFHPSTWAWQSVYWLLAAFSFSWILWNALRPLPLALSAVLAWLFLLCVLYTGDLFYYSLPVIACLGFDPKGGFRKNLLLYFIAIFSGVGALIKFAYAPFPLVFYFILDAYTLFKEKRISCLGAVFVTTVLAGFCLTGQSLADFPEWIRLSFAISSGYGVAMQTSGAGWEVALFALSAAIFVSILFLIGRGKETPFPKGIFLVCILLCFMIVQKAAFVRHDSHGLNCWNVLLICSVFYCASLWRSFRGIFARIFLCALLMMNFILYFAWYQHYFQGSLFAFGLQTPYNSFIQNREILRAFIKSPTGFLDKYLSGYSGSLKQIKESSGLGAIEGTVDYLPPHQMEVIASGLDYRPRPVFQSYSVYMPKLIERHQQFFYSDRAPQNVIFGLDDIDNRYPGTSEGGSWPAFFTRYDPWDFISDNVVLKKRKTARKVHFQLVQSQSLAFGQKLDISAYNSSPVWMVVHFKENILGVLARILFKSPIILARVVTEPNQTAEFRVVPTISEKGELVSPLVRMSMDFADLYFGEDKPLFGRVKTLSFDTSKLGKELYSKINIQLYKVEIEKNFEHETRPALQALLASEDMMRRLEKLSGILEIRVENKRYVAFAHAPSRLRLSVPPDAKKLQIGFGIQEGAWKGQGETDGVCFKVQHASDPNGEIWKQCLQPKTVASDRAEQTKSVELTQSGDDLILVTECLGNCYWDWAYWTNLKALE